MSAFMVNDITYDSIAKYLMQHDSSKVWAVSIVVGDLERYAEAREAVVNRFVERVKLANAEALQARYDDKVEITPTNYRKGRDMSALCFYKQLQCVRYQLSEGDVPDSKIYAKLEKLMSAIAEYVVDHLDEYDKYPWELEPTEAIRARIEARRVV